MSNPCNNTVPRPEVIAALKDWNFAVSVILLFITVLLQWGYPSRCKPIWVIKMFILWLLWPLSIAAAVFAAIHPINSVAFGFAIAFACISGIMWLSYFISSFRLLCRTGSAWSFMPETDMLINIPLLGRTVTRPIISDSPAVQFLIIRGELRFDGFTLGRCDPGDMPDIVTIARPNSLHWYKRALTRNIGTRSAILVYIKYKVGNHRVQNTTEDGDRLAMFVA
uniref:Membrane protein n=1 Tax=Bat coronavirus HKU9-1 TaxID=424367 RepID=A0A6M6CCN7_BCHK9|nr:matrix protein [Bat coronavirus HKU9-1]